jgi:hypothetical protein
MKGTNNVKRLLAAAGALIMGMALVTGFAGCKTDDDEDSDPVAPEFQGTYKRITDTLTLTVGADSFTVVGSSDPATTGISTGGGGSVTGGSWAYVYHDANGTKNTAGIVYKSGSVVTLYLGKSAADTVAATLSGLGATVDTSAVLADATFNGGAGIFLKQ